MRTLLFLTTMLMTGCASVPRNDSAICDGTVLTRQAHAGALVDDGGRSSKRTGAQLIAAIDAACSENGRS